jgi:hypothetical protein
MLLTLEALDASEGDCLLLLYGTATRPTRIMIDGGPSGDLQARTLLPSACWRCAPRLPPPATRRCRSSCWW